MGYTAYSTRSAWPGCVSSASGQRTTDSHSEKSPSTPNGELSGTGVPRNAPSTRMIPREAARNTAERRRSLEVTGRNGFLRSGSPFTYPVPLIRPRPFPSPFTRPSFGRPAVVPPSAPREPLRPAGTEATSSPRSAWPFTASGGTATSHLGRRRGSGNTSPEAEPDRGESGPGKYHPPDCEDGGHR